MGTSEELSVKSSNANILERKVSIIHLCSVPSLLLVFHMEISYYFSRLPGSCRPVVLTFLMLKPFTLVPHAVVTFHHKIILLLVHNCNFATVINHNVYILYVAYLICHPCERLVQTPNGS